MQQYIFTLNENQAALSFLEFVRNLNFVQKVVPVKQTQPAIVEARRGLEETNKVLRALQKSIFLRGKIEQEMKVDSTLKMDGRAK